MPAVLIEAGFINHDRDNEIFDNNFNEIASAIAMGIERVVPAGQMNTARKEDIEEDIEDDMEQDWEEDWEEDDDEEDDLVFGVEVGRFKYSTTANFLAEQLMEQGFLGYVYEDDEMIHVVAGKVDTLEEALKLQKKLRGLGYRTMIIASER